jgi:hypothetical protein
MPKSSVILTEVGIHRPGRRPPPKLRFDRYRLATGDRVTLRGVADARRVASRLTRVREDDGCATGVHDDDGTQLPAKLYSVPTSVCSVISDAQGRANVDGQTKLTALRSLRLSPVAMPVQVEGAHGCARAAVELTPHGAQRLSTASSPIPGTNARRAAAPGTSCRCRSHQGPCAGCLQSAPPRP